MTAFTVKQEVKKQITNGIISAFRGDSELTEVSIGAMEKVIAAAMISISTISFTELAKKETD
jgi:hypothetical protein